MGTIVIDRQAEGIERVDRRPRRQAVDGLVVNSQEVWVLVAAEGEDAVGLLLGEDHDPSEPPLRLCRGILDDGSILIGEADLQQDQLLSDMLRGDEHGNA